MVFILIIPLLFLFLLLPGLVLMYKSTMYFKKNLKSNIKNKKNIALLSFDYASPLTAITSILSFMLLFHGSIFLLQGLLLFVNILGIVAAVIFAVSSKKIINSAKKDIVMFIVYFLGIVLLSLLVVLNVTFSLGCATNPAGCA